MTLRLARKILSTEKPRRKTTLVAAFRRWRKHFRGVWRNVAMWEAMA